MRRPQVPSKPTLDGLEAKWQARWEAWGTYRFDSTRPREAVFSIDTPPLTASGTLHVGHVFSYTHTDLVARYQRMRGRSVFYPVGWDDNGLPTERRVENHFGVRCDPSLPYDPELRPPGAPGQGPPRPGAPNCRCRGAISWSCARGCRRRTSAATRRPGAVWPCRWTGRCSTTPSASGPGWCRSAASCTSWSWARPTRPRRRPCGT